MADADPPELHAVLAELSTERVNDRYADLDLLSTRNLVSAMNAEDAGVAPAVAENTDAIATAVDAISERMLRGGRLIYIGAGTPGRLGVLDASEAPPTFGTDPDRIVGVIAGGRTALVTAVEGAEDDGAAGIRDVADLDVREGDSLVGISASGRTPYVLSAVAEARRRGAFTVGVACNAASDLGAAADVAIDVVVGPELLTGSTRLKAGTAQKMVLNMLSTLTMVRLGKTYGNLMVDLKASNEKLVARSERTVMLATGVDAATAARTLAAVGGSVKAAILVHLGDVTPETAVALLGEHDGFLRRALAEAAR
ncbi:N-acetylmuramic acid 6-phosphate etherase [Mycetocola sp. CAN_C7]|uniref:N-acetylmuramic acid 6-phosphate etherase n=1 Tax=Mycetocola sp. CAN_C7 TaxID=2787724 RepID=UPI0018CA5136